MILYGASGHGKVIAEILEENNIYDIIFWDDNIAARVFEFRVFKPFENIIDQKMIISIGSNTVRKKISEKTCEQFTFAMAIHPNAIISRRCIIGKGSVIMPGVIINTDSTIGRHAIINSGAVIEHDCALDDFTHVSPNATLCGNVSVGQGTHIGAAAVIKQGINIGKWCTIGAGAVVIRDIPDYAVVVGNPGKIINYIQPNNNI